MESNRDVYRRLQEHIDKMPVRFPKTESGSDIRLLKHLFTPEEAEIALELSGLPEPLERIYERVKKTGISIEELEQVLDRLVKKGAILNGKHFVKKKEGKYYSKAMLVIGMYELQVERLTKEFTKDFMDYIDEGFYKEINSKKTAQMRTIPINKSVTPEHYIDTYDNVREIVKNSSGQIAILDCVCREGKDLLEDPCKYSDIRETCLIFEEMADMVLDLGRGRAISKEEAVETLRKAEDAGFILQPSNNRKPHFICCCCGCCCENLRSLKMFPKPAEYFHSNYISEVDPEGCAGCEECVQICHMEAIVFSDNVAKVDHNRCIGCGVCVSKCPSDAIALRKKNRKIIPPRNQDSMYRRIMLERIGIMGVLKMVPKIIMGKKI
jgi:electron transport complex protein RnfB